MIITEVETFVVAVAPGINWTFLRLRTDAGLHGWGECTLEGKDLSVLAAVEELSRSLIGEPVPAPAAAWSGFYRSAPWRGAALYSAMSGIDHALWDLRGKAAGLPVHELLGGPVRPRLHVYTWAGATHDPAALAQGAVDAHARYGFTHFKLAPLEGTHTLDRVQLAAALARVEAVAAVLPPAGRVMVEGHQRLNVPAAVRLADALREFDPAFLEDLVNSDDEASLRALRQRTNLPLAAGEKRYSRLDAWPLLRDGLVDYLLCDLCHAGGITEVQRLAAVAETVGVGLVPHNPNGPIGMAATLQVAAASPGVLASECVHERFALMAELSGAAPDVRDGYVAVPRGPGLGVELDVDALRAHRGEPADFPMQLDGTVAGGRL